MEDFHIIIKIIAPLSVIIIGLIGLIYNKIEKALADLHDEQRVIREKIESIKDELKNSDWDLKEKNLELLNIINKDFVTKKECEKISEKKVEKHAN